MAGDGKAVERRALWVVLAVYVAVELAGAWRHELWLDELHNWNIARLSATPFALLRNIRYEGHPPIWHLVLWVASRFTRSVGGLHAAQLAAASGAAALVLFAAPFRPWQRVLILCGYFFLFEYGVLCRSYAVGVLLLFSLCVVVRRGRPARPVLYYVLLFALANVHFLFLVLAASLHVSVLWHEARRDTMERRRVLRHAALGAALLLIPFLSIVPPDDSPLSPSFWLGLWSPKNLFEVMLAPLRGLLPLPAWWRDHFWNTQALIEVGREHLSLRVVAACASVSLVAAIILVVPRRGVARTFLVVSLVLCLAAAVFFPLTSARYAGVLFIAFLAAFWIGDTGSVSRRSQAVVTSLLVVHALAGAFALQRDWRLPFSRSPEIGALVATVPPGEAIVSDYTTLEAFSAYLDRPVYSLQQGKTVRFSNYDRSLDPHRSYADGLDRFFTASGAREAFLLSPWPLDDSRVFDAAFVARFQAVLLGEYDGAIEPCSDIHLYRVTRRD